MAQQENNIYLNRLKEQYISVKNAEKIKWNHTKTMRENDYFGMRLFCLDTQLVSFNDIEAMENEVNQSFS